MSEPRITTLLRSPHTLSRWWAHVEIAPSESGEAEPLPTQGFEVFGTNMSAGDRELFEAWERLGQVAELCKSVREDVELVLNRTIAHPHEEVAALPPLDLEPPPQRPKATAAHPRAYQGTKKQPPKARRSSAQDLRPYFGSRWGMEQIKRRLRGLDPDPAAPFDAPFESWEAPPRLRLALGLIWRAGWTAGERSEVEVLWRHVGGEEQLQLGPQLAFAASRGSAEDAVEFLRSIAAVLPDQRAGVAFGLLGVIGTVPGAICFHDGLAAALAGLSMEAAGALGGHPVELVSWTRLLAAVPVEERSAVLAGVRLAARFGQGKAVNAERVPREEMTKGLMKIVGELELRKPLEWWAALGLSSAGLSVMELVLGAARREEISLGMGANFLNHNSWSLWSVPATLAPKALTGNVDEILSAFKAAGPDYQGQAWDTYVQVTADGHLRYYTVVARSAAAIGRWCRPPFRASSEMPLILERLIRVSDEHWERVLAAPDEPFLILEALAERSVDASLISLGLETILELHEAWALNQILERPRAFGRLLRLLGMLSEERQRELLRGGLESYSTPPDTGASLEEAVRSVDRLPLPTGANPVALKVRSHLRGELILTAGQIARQLALMRAAWPDLVVASLRGDVLGALAAGLLDQDRALEPLALEQLPEELNHALMFQAGLESNRRSLRRMIRALFGGDVEFLARHPRNREWMNELAKCLSQEAAEVWASPPSAVIEVEGIGEVTLAVEHEPLEALRMGTYVGSCYAVGGYFRFAAAAVVLDINKHVVFARRKDGTFLARQIIAVSDSWWLHCSYVYPAQIEGPLQEAFFDYDRMLASHCKMQLAGDGDEGKGIVQCLVSEDDWDDGLAFS